MCADLNLQLHVCVYVCRYAKYVRMSVCEYASCTMVHVKDLQYVCVQVSKLFVCT